MKILDNNQKFKNSPDRFNNRMEIIEERVSELEDRSTEIILCRKQEKEKEKRNQ